MKARKLGITTPVLYDVELEASTITMERVAGCSVKQLLLQGTTQAGEHAIKRAHRPVIASPQARNTSTKAKAEPKPPKAAPEPAKAAPKQYQSRSCLSGYQLGR